MTQKTRLFIRVIALVPRLPAGFVAFHYPISWVWLIPYRDLIVTEIGACAAQTILGHSPVPIRIDFAQTDWKVLHNGRVPIRGDDFVARETWEYLFFFCGKKNHGSTCSRSALSYSPPTKPRRAKNSLIQTCIYLGSWFAGSLRCVSCAVSIIWFARQSLVIAWNRAIVRLGQFSATALSLFEVIMIERLGQFRATILYLFGVIMIEQLGQFSATVWCRFKVILIDRLGQFSATWECRFKEILFL